VGDASFHFPAHEGRVVPIAFDRVPIELPDQVRVENADIGRCADRQVP
jgi:hypothetical protein